MLVKIPYDRTADRVAALLAREMETLPESLCNSITWDQGKERKGHPRVAQPHHSRFMSGWETVGRISARRRYVG